MERLQLRSRWPWLVVILLVSLLGAILFLAVGRTDPPAPDPLAAPDPATRPGPDPTRRAMDLLYGDRGATDRHAATDQQAATDQR